jgi:hypothetical protein
MHSREGSRILKNEYAFQNRDMPLFQLEILREDDFLMGGSAAFETPPTASATLDFEIPSFPRRRESRGVVWIPTSAGMTCHHVLSRDIALFLFSF